MICSGPEKSKHRVTSRAWAGSSYLMNVVFAKEQESCALSGRNMYSGTFPGRCPGWHAPRRWRVIVAEFSSGENCNEAIYEIAAGEKIC